MQLNNGNNYRIIVLWDSVVEWAGSSDGKGWVGILREKYWSKWIRITNLGIGWHTSLDVLNRTSVLYGYKPDRIILAVGINDSCIQTKLSQNPIIAIEDFKKIFWEILHKCGQNGTEIRIVWLTSVDESFTQPLAGSNTGKSYYNHIIEQYNQALQQIAVYYECRFLLPYSLLDTTDLTDGLHPNDGWYKKMAEFLEKFIIWD
jgi:lysophospholipase L1-like esterase